MIVLKIDPRGSLSQRQMETIKAKLKNTDGISTVPVNVAGDNVTIGSDWSEFINDWEFVHRLVSRQRSTYTG